MKTMTLGVNELDSLCNELPEDGIILLVGNLAAGKTTLVKAIALSLHVKEEVSSPTFSVMNVYEEKLFHYDIYQNGTNGFLQQGLLENLTQDGLHVIEWADDSFEKMLKNIGLGFTKISIEVVGDKRQYRIENA